MVWQGLQVHKVKRADSCHTPQSKAHKQVFLKFHTVFNPSCMQFQLDCYLTEAWGLMGR